MKEQFIGFDIGGTNVRTLMAGNLDEAGNNLNQMKKTPFISCENIEFELDINICNIVYEYQKVNDVIIKGIGISLAASVDRQSGIITAWPNHKSWIGFNVRDYLTHKFQVPVKIEDDANCGALGEYYYGNRSYCGNMVYITLGTGIGCGIIINGSIYVGESGFAGEIGHTIVNSDTLCTCGQRGCLQASKEDYHLKKNNIALAIYNLVMILDISKIVIGGGASIENPSFFKDIEELVNDKLKYFNRKIDVFPAANKDGSGVLGALHLFI